MNTATESRDLIFVLGMHRSGTSAATRLVNLMGANLGESLLEAEPSVNDKGFWENSELVAINQGLLEQLSSRWFDFGALPAGWWEAPELAPLVARIEQFLLGEFAASPLAALKDPRLCRLQPLWSQVCQRLHFNPRYLLVLRSPDEVRRSLLRRDPFTPLTADLLWLRHVADAERHSRAGPRCRVAYDTILADREGAVAQIAEALQIRWPIAFDTVREQVAQEIDAGLRHHRGERDDHPSVISESLRSIYDALCRAGSAALPAALESEIDALLAAYQPCAEAILETNRYHVSTRVALQEVGGELAYARSTVARRDEEKRGVEAQLATLGEEHAHALAVIRQRDSELKEMDGRLQQLGEAHSHALAVVKERDEQLAQRNAEFLQLERWAKALEPEAMRYRQIPGPIQAALAHPLAQRLFSLFRSSDLP